MILVSNLSIRVVPAQVHVGCLACFNRRFATVVSHFCWLPMLELPLFNQARFSCTNLRRTEPNLGALALFSFPRVNGVSIEEMQTGYTGPGVPAHLGSCISPLRRTIFAQRFKRQPAMFKGPSLLPAWVQLAPIPFWGIVSSGMKLGDECVCEIWGSPKRFQMSLSREHTNTECPLSVALFACLLASAG